MQGNGRWGTKNRTHVTKLCCPRGNVWSTGLRPVRSSRRTTPKLYTSLFEFSCPVMAYLPNHKKEYMIIYICSQKWENKVKWTGERKATHSGAWYPNVPRTRVEWRRAAISGAWFDRSKSAILATSSSKINTLLDLISRWTIWGTAFSWRYSRPLAAPTAILTRWAQERRGPGCAPFTPFLP